MSSLISNCANRKCLPESETMKKAYKNTKSESKLRHFIVHVFASKTSRSRNKSSFPEDMEADLMKDVLKAIQDYSVNGISQPKPHDLLAEWNNSKCDLHVHGQGYFCQNTKDTP